MVTKCRHWTVSEAESMYHICYGGFICATPWCFELQRQGDILRNERASFVANNMGKKL